MPDKEESILETFLSLVFLAVLGYSIYWGFSDTKLGLIASAKKDVAWFFRDDEHRAPKKTRQSQTVQREIEAEDEPELELVDEAPTTERISTPPVSTVEHTPQQLEWYSCASCGTVIKSSHSPSGRCPGQSGYAHSWHALGPEGNHNFQCRQCGAVVTSNNEPKAFVECAASEERYAHAWAPL